MPVIKGCNMPDHLLYDVDNHIWFQEQPDGTVEYEYIERIKEGARTLQERHYIITMKDGKVVSKRVKQNLPAPYLFDSYEMQTTQVESEESESVK